MKTFFNIIWCIFIGFFSLIYYYFLGALLCLTIIGIPLGLQLFKIGRLLFMPFGKQVETHFEKHPVGNVLWLIFFGLTSFLGYIFAGVVLCITIIFIPLGLQAFKIAKIMLFPFGSKVIAVAGK